MYPALIKDRRERDPIIDPAFLQARNDRDGFLRYFGFRESPFGVTPDPGFLFFSKTHRAALQAMIHSIESNLGFTVLLGDPGTGKTTLLFQLLTQYRDSARTAFIFQTQCKPHDLLRHVASELELPGLKRDEVSLHQRLKQVLVKEAWAGRKVLIIIDEAQNLQHASLEAIRLLSNFETAPAKLLHVILAGSSRLGETLLAPELSQLAQRVSAVCRLRPLNAEEVKAYVAFRLGAAGSRVVEGLFSPESLDEIADRSGGVPRLVNSICYRALSLAYAAGKRQVDGELVRQAARDLDLSEFSGTNLSVANQLPQPGKQDDCAPPADIVSREKDAAPDSCRTSLELGATQYGEKSDFHSGAAHMVVNSPEEQPHSKTISAGDPNESRFAEAGPLSDPSARHVTNSRFVRFKSASLRNDRPAVLLAALILLALGFWIGWHGLRAKSSTSAQYSAAVRPDFLSPENEDEGAPVVSQPTASMPTAEPNIDQADHKPVDGNGINRATPVIEIPPDTLLPARIGRQSPGVTDPAAPSDIAGTSANPDALRLPLATFPALLPRLNKPMNQAANAPPAFPLQPTKVVQPEYPNAAKLRHIEGDVLLELEVDSGGNVQKVRTLSGNSILKDAAEDAVWQWHFPPSRGNQSAVPAVTQVRLNFRLNPEAKQ